MTSTTTTTDALMTASQLAMLPDDGMMYELVQGRLVQMPPSSFLSSAVAVAIAVLLDGFVRPRRLGVVGGADGGVRLATNPDTVRAPDVSFVRRERLPGGRLVPGYFEGAPDLAVEVLSPSDRWPKVLTKVEEYLAAGVRLVWVIDPETRTAFVFRPGRSHVAVPEDGMLDGDDVLPGFTLSLARLWASLDLLDSDPASQSDPSEVPQ